MTPKPCSYPGCVGQMRARGYCNAHYQRLRLGKELGPLQQYIRKDGSTAEDVFNMYAVKQSGCWGWTGTLSTEGYAMFCRGGNQRYAHRVSYEIHKGEIPPGMFIDHMCFTRSCTNPAHLQAVTNKQNHENRPGVQPNNTSGVRGVSWNKSARKFEVYATHQGVRHRGGFFRTLPEADEAAIALRNSLFTNNLLDRKVR